MDFWSIAVFFSFAVVALELATVWRRGVVHYRGYFALLLVDAGLLSYTISEDRFSREGGGPWPELVAGVLLCGLIVFVPRLLDRWLRGALARDRIELAVRLAGIKEILRPGRAATAERELLIDLVRVKRGEVDAVVRMLRARLIDADPIDEPLLHERVITVYSVARRFEDATQYFESRIGMGLIGRLPSLAVQMVTAYGELGAFDRAAAVVHAVEEAARVNDAGAMTALLQVRLMFLAALGGYPLLERLFSDRDRARLPTRLKALLANAARPRLAVVVGSDTTTEQRTPSEEVLRFADAVAERVAADMRPFAATAKPRATKLLVAANCIAFAAVIAVLGGFESGYDLVRSGASFHVAVRGGELWRLWTAMFLHGGDGLSQGLIHLGLNMYGLYLLGRVVEPLFGWLRFVGIYAVAGLVGNIVSAYNPNPFAALSVGASGAVLGILGALLVALLMRRGGWPDSARRVLIINLLVLLAAQLGIGALIRVVDNFAHVGGLLGGMAMAWLLMPGGVLGRGRIATAVVVAVVVALGGSALWSATSLATTSVESTMARIPRREVEVDGVRLSVPAHVGRITPSRPEWPGEELLIDQIAQFGVAPHLLPIDRRAGEAAALEVIRRCMERDRRAIAEAARAVRSEEPSVEEVPVAQVPGWVGAAQVESKGDTRRMLYYARPAEDERWAVVVEVTYEGAKAMERAAEEEIARIVSSARMGAVPRALEASLIAAETRGDGGVTDGPSTDGSTADSDAAAMPDLTLQ